MYLTFASRNSEIYTEKGSKFIGIGFSCSDLTSFKKELENIKKEYPKATHYCYAGIFGDPLELRSSDDGEPSGSAGQPILGQLRANGLEQVALIVLRFYGGQKLGVSGLIHAYKESARITIESAIIEKSIQKTPFTIKGDYIALMQFFSKNQKSDWGLELCAYPNETVLTALIPQNQAPLFKAKLSEFHNLHLV